MSTTGKSPAAATRRPSSRLFAFSGVDMIHGGLDLLRRAVADGCRILALDAQAIGIARREGVEFTVVDDWLGDNARAEAHRLAYEAEVNWFRACRDAFVADGVCWPEFDHHAMSYFWQEVFLAEAIAGRCREAGVRELRFRKVRPRRAGLYYDRVRMCGSFWELAYPGLTHAYNLSVAKQARWQAARAMRLAGGRISEFWRSMCSSRCPHRRQSQGCRWGQRLLQKARHLPKRGDVSLAGDGLKDFSCPDGNAARDSAAVSQCASAPREKGLVVLALNWAELHRFREVIRIVGEAFPQRVIVRLLTDDPGIAAQFAGQFPVPVYPGPSPEPLSTQAGEVFVRGFEQASRMARGAPWERALKSLGFHFDYYCGERWPRLRSQYRAWKALWEECPPAVVIVSSLPDGESQVPAQAAGAVGIPSLSIPHGAGVVRAWHAIAAERVLYDMKAHQVVHARSGVPAERLVPCRGLLAQDDYSLDEQLWTTPPAVKRVLALTDPISPMGGLSGWVGHAAQIRGLQALAACPEDLADRLDVRFKANPAWPDMDLFEAAGIDVRGPVFPAATRLGPLLAAADLVIAVNYCGGALVHALRASKPVVLFWGDPLLHGQHDFWHPEVYSSCGPMARSGDELWDWLRRFVEQPDTAVRMRSKADAFRREFLDDSAYPSLVEVVGSAIPFRRRSNE